MGFQSWTLAPVLGAIALVVGCTQEASDGADANGGAAGSPSAGAGNDAGASGGPLAGAPGDGGESGSSFAGAPGEETTPSRLTCLGVLQCAGACPDENADACVEDCLNQTSESSQP